MLTTALKFFSLLLLAVNIASAITSKELLVNTTNGAVLGRYMKSNTGQTIRAFMGIPFAEPPVGDLRFKPPQKKASWNPTILATQNEPPKCAQSHFLTKEFEGQEDCLYLNVYAPELQNHSNAIKFPVMVWIHGGSLITGHGGISEHGPDYILDTDVIFVSGNYRLGSFGFLSTEDEILPGNNGLQDQVAVLKWVQENIEAFGGDKDSVTIFGQSSGGVCVNFHMISPVSQNLFHRAISQSGTLQNFWSGPELKGVAKSRAEVLAEHFKCPNIYDSREIVDCLRKVDVKDLAKSLMELHSDLIEYTTPYLPVLEVSNEESFITPETYTCNQRAREIPWLVGLNSEEGALVTQFLYSDNGAKLLEWEDKISKYNGYNHLSEEEQDEITAAIRDFYFNNEEISSKNLENQTNLFGDSSYLGMFDMLETRFKNTSYDNTYVYLYSHRGAASFTEVVGRKKFLGTTHMDELFSLFPLYESKQFYTSIPTHFDRALHRLMPHLWANFAKTGNPNVGHINPSIHSNQFWPTATKFPLNYMRIGNDNGNARTLLQARVDLFPDRVDFWRKLKEKYPIIKFKLE